MGKKWKGKWKEQTTHLTLFFKFISLSKEGICGCHFKFIYGLTVLCSLYMGIKVITEVGQASLAS